MGLKAVAGGYNNSTFTGVTTFPNGTAAAPPIVGASSTTTGPFWRSGAIFSISISGTENHSFSSSMYGMPSTGAIGWCPGTDPSGTPDVRIKRDALGVLAMHGTSSAVLASMRRYGGNAGYVEWGSVSENLTLSTGGATTDTAADLLPANSFIETVTARITTTIATATDWAVGDPTTAGRFNAANATLAAGTTSVGLVHFDIVGAGGPRQTAAAKVRITTTGTPSAGAIRLTSYYRTYVAPTS